MSLVFFSDQCRKRNDMRGLSLSASFTISVATHMQAHDSCNASGGHFSVCDHKIQLDQLTWDPLIVYVSRF